MLFRAGLVTGFGRLGVSNAIWDKPDAAHHWRVGAGAAAPAPDRTMLRQSALSARSSHRRAPPRRLDGSGYPGGPVRAGPSRVPGGSWGAADAYQAMREPRPHRAAMSAADAAARAAAGGARGPDGRCRRSRRRARTSPGIGRAAVAPGPAGLTTREVEVLCLVAKGHVQENRSPTGSSSPSRQSAPRRAHLHQDRTAHEPRRSRTFSLMQHGLLPDDEYVTGP